MSETPADLEMTQETQQEQSVTQSVTQLSSQQQLHAIGTPSNGHVGWNEELKDALCDARQGTGWKRMAAKAQKSYIDILDIVAVTAHKPQGMDVSGRDNQ